MYLYKKLLIPSLLVLILYIYIPHFVNSFTLETYLNSYAFSGLHINYEGGFIRRGLLGQLSIIFLPYIDNISFFASLFTLLYLIQIILFLTILNKLKNSTVLLLFFSLSPALIFFSIYRPESYMFRDVFFNLAILLHSIVASKNIEKKISINKYKSFLFYLLIPFLFINILIHEVQLFLISIHILISFVIFGKNFKTFVKKSFLKVYLILLIPIVLVLINSGTPEQVFLINNSLEQYGSLINQGPFNVLKGNINLMFGQVLKMMVYYTYIDFINFFIALILSLFVFLSLFNYLIEKNILIVKKPIHKIYGFFFLPCILLFVVGTDFGRWLNIISVHIFAFFMIFKIDTEIKLFKNKLGSNFIQYSLLFIFLFSYIFLWEIPAACCWFTAKIFSSSLFNELFNSTIFYYKLINTHIIELPLNNFLK